jgi:TonB family protein
MRHLLNSLALAVGATVGHAQSGDITTDSLAQPMVEVAPRFPGGEMAFYAFMQENLIYPETCMELGIQGRVYVEFTVDKVGSITDARVVRSAHPMLDAEALRVVNAMPSWEPGTMNGDLVLVRYNVPVTFRLAEGGTSRKKRRQKD